MRMYSARSGFVRGSDVVPWAFAIARRLLIDTVRRSKNDPLFVSAACDLDWLEGRREAPEEIAAVAEIAALLQAELATIPESHRAAFEMIRFDGLSVDQVAEVLGASKSATKVRAHRVYERLREALAKLGWDAAAL
jgi:RNA polymerase sigma-70 factor (ECF subfamily)